MKKSLAFAMFLILAVALTSPFSVSAKTKAGAKPGSFFYFFDKAFEKTSLFFTFSTENKARKALEYAEERLAEAEELKKEKEEKEIKNEAVKNVVTELKKEVEPLRKEFVELQQKQNISQSAKVAKEATPQNPQCLIFKDQIDAQNNKRIEIKRELKMIEGVSDNVCDGKTSDDQTNCINERIKILQEIALKNKVQITDIELVLKELKNDYKKHNCN